jgi:HSP20 family protein
MAQKTKSPVEPGGALARLTSPFSLLDELRHELDRVWDWPRLGRTETEQARMTWWPRMDIFEKKGKLVVQADLPGMTRENVHVAIEEGDLVLRGERTEEKEVSKESYYRSERTFGSFYRRIPLSFEIEPEKVDAAFRDGVLHVELPLPKAEEKKPKAREILVH